MRSALNWISIIKTKDFLVVCTSSFLSSGCIIRKSYEARARCEQVLQIISESADI